MKKVIEFKNVRKEYDLGTNKIIAVDGINFTINEGEFVVILGPSGAGKSTILNLLGGMDHATSGEIIVGENNIVGLSDNQLSEYRANEVGFVFQFYNLIPTLTALENVALMKDIKKDSLEPIEVLNNVGLGEHINQFPTQLSGGEQQRVSIARAICKNPMMLLCDEPTGALDSETGILILTLLQRLSLEDNKTVIIVTHNAVIAEAADKVIRVKNGRIKEIILNETPKSISEVNW
jgi:putative ABC transport system ATP-binding protein